jgi:uncharacterized protein
VATPVTYPGVYIREVPSGARTISGVATSVTAFIGRAARGPLNQPVRVQNFGEFERRFGGLWRESTLGYSVRQFFMNGGGDALIVRVDNGGTAARFSLPTGGTDLVLDASSPGEWGNALRVVVDHDTRPLAASEATEVFNLTVLEVDPATNAVRASEVFRNISVNAASSRYVGTVLEQEANFVRLVGSAPAARPNATPPATPAAPGTAGTNGSPITATQVQGSAANKTGIFALEDADLFNLLCIPPLTPTTNVTKAVWDAAAAYCMQRRAVLLVDPPANWDEASDVTPAAIGNLVDRVENAALFFPRLQAPDPLRENRLAEYAPSGAVAGVIARTDSQRGVWKAPAGLEAGLRGVSALTVKMTDGENGVINPLGVNALRTFPAAGHVVWGARTLRGADQLASEWKYLPVRRLALFIEESLFRGTQWAVFEPNDEPLWGQLRLSVGAFMQNLFRQGAFQGSSASDAYFVKCDAETTPQNDIDLGIVNIHVGFAPLKPAEFVVIHIQQIAGQVQT